MVTYGIVGGIGFGMIYLPAIVSVGYYFEKKRALATGIAVCGSGFGTFVFAPVAAMLLEAFDWKGANLILAGLILNCAVRYNIICIIIKQLYFNNSSLVVSSRFSVLSCDLCLHPRRRANPCCNEWPKIKPLKWRRVP